ncbi:MAG: hypothetical protein R6V04_16835 [bacterium]
MKQISQLLFLNFICFFCIGFALGEKGYDLIHYDLNIIPDFNQQSIDLKVTIIVNNYSLEDSLWFGLNQKLEYLDVKNGKNPVQYERKDNWVLIILQNPQLEIQLNFNIKGNPGICTNEQRHTIEDSSLFLLWSERFYPIDFEDWATVKTTIVLPKGFLAVAPGKLIKNIEKDNTIEYQFETTEPAVCYSVFADNRWLHTEKTINNIPIHTFLHPQSQKYVDQILTSSAEIINYYSQIFCPYSFDQFCFITLDGIYARRAFCGYVGYSPEYLKKEFTSTGHDAHESALLWWGYTLRGTGPGAFQWTEGFGDYAEFMYDEAYGKPIPPIFQHFREEYLKIPREEDKYYYELGGAPQKYIHGKYPWLMHILRYKIGNKAFQNALHYLFSKYLYQTFTMDEFVNTLQKGAGQPLNWWKEEWLERKGVPELTVTAEIMPVSEGYSLMLDIEQEEAVYHLPVEVEFEIDDKTIIKKIDLNEKEEQYTFQFDSRPEQVLLDPNGWILMKHNKIIMSRTIYNGER